MIVSKISGGLGNQMFQFAAGRRLAHHLGTNFKLDTSWFDQFDNRQFSLGCFDIEVEIATDVDLSRLRPFSKRLDKLLSKCPFHQSSLVKERHYNFDPSVLNLKGDLYLDGYWQSYKYFQDISEIIGADFSLSRELSDATLETAKEIESCESVSIHIRRGDYLTVKENIEKYINLKRDYYSDCVSYIKSRVDNSVFFLFSDEVDWDCTEYFDFSRESIRICNAKRPDYEDLHLMRLCKHNIIANSSFSWWGAWLNKNPEKIVCAPKQWFTEISGRKTGDLIPPEWMTL